MEDNVLSVRHRRTESRRGGRWRIGVAWLLGAALALSGTAAIADVAPAGADIEGSVYVGSKHGYGGTGMYPVWSDGVQEGEPDYWAYCIEHDVSAKTNTLGQVGDIESYLGENHFLSEEIQGKVLWVLAHSYPAVSLDDFAAAVGAPDMVEKDAIEATQYAIWRYTDLTFDASWQWETAASEAAYWYLVNGANAATGLPPEYFEVTATIEASTEPQTVGDLIGPFTVHTNQERVTVSTDSSLLLVDADGNVIDAAGVFDSQEIYLDARGETAAGGATVTVTASGTSNTGKVISVPIEPGTTPTTGSHAQSLILVTPDTTKTTDSAHLDWSGIVPEPEPLIGTTLVDDADGDHVLAWDGGTLVDTVAYENLTPGVAYTLEGVLMDKATGESTGITGSTTFTPDAAGGTVEVVFDVPADFAGDVLVAFEQLFEGTTDAGTIEEEPSAVHEDINDVDQTVTVEEEPVVEPTPEPSIGTTLVDAADGDHVLAWNGGTLVDTVAYEGLTPGASYTVEGVLMDKATGEPTGLTGSTTFTPESAEGTVDVVFEVPEDYAGDVLVAFEQLFEVVDDGGTLEEEPSATHEDINDVDQTVSVEEEPVVEPTPEPSVEPTPEPSEEPTPETSESPAPQPSAPAVVPEPSAPSDGSPTSPPRSDSLSPTGGSPAGTITGAAFLVLLAGGALMVLRRRARHQS